MKNSSIAGLLLAGLQACSVFVHSASAAPVEMTLMPGSDTWVQGIYFKPNSVLTLNDGLPIRGILGSTGYFSRNVVWAPNTEVELDSKLEVTSGTVSSGSYQAITLKPGAQVRYFRTGVPAVVVLNNDTTVSGDYVGAADSMVYFYLNGSIRAAKVTKDFAYTAPGSLLSYQFLAGDVAFYPTQNTQPNLTVGPVREAKLRVNHINPNTLDNILAGTTLTLDYRGDLIKLYGQSVPVQYRRITFPAGTTLEMLSEGYFTAFSVSAIQIGGKTYPALQRLVLDVNGNVVAAKPAP